MARPAVACALVLLVAVVSQASAASNLFGTAGGPRLFEALPGAGAFQANEVEAGEPRELAQIGVRLNLWNNTAVDIKSFDVATAGASLAGAAANQFIAMFENDGPCYHEDLAVHMPPSLTFGGEKDLDEGRVTVGMLLVGSPSDRSQTTFDMSGLNRWLDMCLPPAGPTESGSPADMAGFQYMEIQARVMGRDTLVEYAELPGMRINLFAARNFATASGAATAQAVLEMGVFKALLGSCVMDNIESERDEVLEDLFIEDINIRWAEVDSEDGEFQLAFKAMIDIPWRSPAEASGDEGALANLRLQPEDMKRVMYGMCIDYAFNSSLLNLGLQDGSGVTQAAVVISDRGVTADTNGGYGMFVVESDPASVGAVADMVSADNYKSLELAFAGALQTARADPMDHRYLTPAYIDVSGFSYDQAGHIFVLVKAHLDDHDDYFPRDNTTAAIEAALSDVMDGMPVSMNNVDGNDSHEYTMFEQFDVIVSHDSVNSTLASQTDAFRATFAAAMMWTTMAHEGEPPCEGCEWSVPLDGSATMNGTYVSDDEVKMFGLNVNVDVQAHALDASTLVMRTMVGGEPEDVERFFARLGSDHVHAMLADQSGCDASGTCDSFDLTLRPRNSMGRHQHNLLFGRGSGIEVMARMAGVSFTTANSPQFRLAFEYTAELLLSEAGVPIDPEDDESQWLQVTFDGCGYEEAAFVRCLFSVKNGNTTASWDNTFNHSVIRDIVHSVFEEEDGLMDALMSSLDYPLGLLLQPEERDLSHFQVLVSVPGRNVDLPIEDMNNQLQQAFAMLASHYNLTSMYADSWQFDGCLGYDMAVCMVEFTPEPFMSFIDEDMLDDIIQGVFYTMSTGPMQVPDDNTPQEVFVRPPIRAIGQCSSCGFTNAYDGWHMHSGYYNRLRVTFLAELRDDPNYPATNAMLRAAAYMALQDAGLDNITISDVRVYSQDGGDDGGDDDHNDDGGNDDGGNDDYTDGGSNDDYTDDGSNDDYTDDGSNDDYTDDGSNDDHNDDGGNDDNDRKEQSYEVVFFTPEWENVDGLRQFLNTAMAENFASIALHPIGTPCIGHLFKYEVYDPYKGHNVRYLATDSCEMLFSKSECDTMDYLAQHGMMDDRCIDDGQGNKYYISKDQSFDSTGLEECGCDHGACGASGY